MFKELSKIAQQIYEERKQNLSSWSQVFYSYRESVTKNNSKIGYHSENLLSNLLEEVITFLQENSFVFYEESEIVKVSDNFDSLLIPKGHSARASSDSFFLSYSGSDQEKHKEEMMLRTHTTTSTLKLLKKNKNSFFRGASFGSVYRKEDNNSTHLSQFTQLDLVWVDKELSIDHLRALIEQLLYSLLGSEGRYYRLRSSFFPFTSPSYEVDVSCLCNSKKGCRLCKGSGWIEVLGCGFLRTEILQKTHEGAVAIAAGLGIERLGMIKHTLKDIRTLYKNDFNKLVVFTK